MSAIRNEIKPMLALALPLVLAELGWMFMAVVDTIMVGHLPNPAITISSAALAQVIYNTLAFGIGGVLLGLDTTIAQSHGAGKLDDANRWLLHGLVLAAVLTALLMAIVAAGPFALHHLPVQPLILTQAIGFLQALNTGTPALLLLPHPAPLWPAGLQPRPPHRRRPHFRQPDQRPRRLAPALPPPPRPPAPRRLRRHRRGLLHLHRPSLPRRRAPRRHLARQPQAPLRPALHAASPGALAPQAPRPPGCPRRRPDLRRDLHLRRRHRTHRHPRPTPARRPRDRPQLRQHHLHGALRHLRCRRRARRPGHRPPLSRGGYRRRLDRHRPRCRLHAHHLGRAARVPPHHRPRLHRRPRRDRRRRSPAARSPPAFQLFDGLQITASGALRGVGNTHAGLIVQLIGYWVVGLPVGLLLGYHFKLGAVGLWLGLCTGLIIAGVALILTWRRAARSLAVHPVTP